MSKRYQEWGAFLFLGLLGWGTSFLWIKIALRETGPFTIVLIRMLFGMTAAWILLRTQTRRPLPRGATFWLTLLLGAVNTAIPITLITWSETRIDSGLAGIINSTTPLFTILIAHQFLHDDRITVPKITGLVTGFIGIFILLSRELHPGGFHGSIWGQLAVMGAAICYAGANVFVRLKLRGLLPMEIAAISLTGSLLTMLIITPFFEWPIQIPQLPMTWLAMGWMGIIGLAFAYKAYFFLLESWGATRATMVTYVFPVSAVALGVIFLGEQPTWHVFAGGALVIGGIALVNVRKA
jgi:drug/metabolite transporter (DMT)-like permease